MSGSNKANCYNAFEEGIKIMHEISGTKLTDLKLTRSKLIKTIASANSKITVDKNTVEIDPDVLFHRICVIRKTDDEMQDYLKWELSPFPQAFFDTFGMLKNTKSDLYTIFEKVHTNIRDPARVYYVIDGGFLIHKIKWTLGETFGKIIEDYMKYIRRNYGNSITVVFDGYDRITTKSYERLRRQKHAISTDVFFNESMPLKISQEKFLNNTKNKSKIIKMLQNKLSEEQIHSIQCPADADRTIVMTAIELARDKNKKVLIVAEDTDIPVLVITLTPPDLEVFVVKPARANKPEEVYSSKSLDHIPNVSNNILLLHALTGCDTVSATYFQGKKKFFKIFQSYPDLLSHAEKFKEKNVPSDELIEHGCQLLLAMYGAPLSFRKPNVPAQYKPNTIQLAETYRYRMYLMAVSKTKKIQIGKILPTVDAIIQHLKRVYLQVQNWLLGEENNEMNAVEWGWELKDNVLVPIKMTKAAGPPSVMTLIFCGCKKDCGNLCGCRRQGLLCSVACKNCLGSTCSNIETFTDADENNEEENDSVNSDNETCE